MTEGAFEARKWGWRQTKEGIVVSFLVHPNDINADLAIAPLGTIYAIGFREQPEGDQTTGPDAALILPPVATPEAEAQDQDKPRRHMSRTQRAGMLCNDRRFQDWAWEDNQVDGVFTSMNEYAAEFVRRKCGVRSRKELDNNAAAAKLWDTLHATYLRDTGQMAEQRS